MRRQPTWTAETVIAAVQAFHAKNGYQPVQREAHSAYGLPSTSTIERLFGSWNAMIEAAGFTPYPARSSAQAKRRAFLDRNPPNIV